MTGLVIQELCGGTIQSNGICDKCFQPSASSSNKCVRLIEKSRQVEETVQPVAPVQLIAPRKVINTYIVTIESIHAMLDDEFVMLHELANGLFFQEKKHNLFEPFPKDLALKLINQ